MLLVESNFVEHVPYKLFQKSYQLHAKQTLLHEARLPLDDSPHQSPAQCRAHLMLNKFNVACAGCNTKLVLMHWGSFDMSAYNGMTDCVQTCAVLASYLALLYNDTSHGRIRERLAQCLLC
jgi:hypothetical protein